RRVLDAHRGLLAAEAAHSAAIADIPVGSKRREPADHAMAAAREAYRLHVSGMIERIARSRPGSSGVSSTDDLLTLAITSYLGRVPNNANLALVNCLVHQAGAMRFVGDARSGTLVARGARR